MNASLDTSTRRAPSTTTNVVALPIRERREREFGVGYGRSSGYASDKRYVKDWGLTRFRCA